MHLAAESIPAETAFSSGLLGLILLARYHGVAADPEQISHRHPPRGSEFGPDDVLRAARALGLKARRAIKRSPPGCATDRQPP